jgi:phosphatidylserine decarboxylase
LACRGFSELIRIDRAGAPFIVGALALAALAGAFAGWPLATPFLVLAAGFLFFFRDPDRRAATADDRAVVSPADGRVLVAGAAGADGAPPGSWLQISIFLSPADVHVNRIPVSGRVSRVSFTRGRFLPAFRESAGAVNERTEIWIDHAGEPVVVRQVVGVLARRVVCRVASGADVRAGERFGIMKFGSRMDVFLPRSATILVKAGERVRGGETVIAVLH